MACLFYRWVKWVKTIIYKPRENEDLIIIWSSEEGRRADALALGAEEGRDKLR